MTNNQLNANARAYSRNQELQYQAVGLGWNWKVSSGEDGFKAGFTNATALIIEHLKTLPLDTMTGKQVEESLFNEFLHVQ